ncbi:MAG TPA: F0F1 ATP synthase subunit delta [Dehalococcoidia bacterium]|nr:F0F1 ATP synthase subunit delta [Dehalococcoidia bacterium]
MTNQGHDHARAAAAVSGDAVAARRYAQAVFELAQERGDAAAWQDSLRQIAEFMSDPEVRRVLENARVSQEAKQRLVAAALADLPGLALNFARLLVRKGRTNLAWQIADQFNQMLEAQSGISRARAITAVPIGDAEREALQRRLEEQLGRKVVIEPEVDPNLLGGVVIQIGDRLIDASTRAKLRALRESLVGT